MSYKNLEIWKLARTIVIKIYKMTLNDLPKFEMYEVGGQIRRSSKSTKSNIVEGYGVSIHRDLALLGKKLNNFIKSVNKNHISPK